MNSVQANTTTSCQLTNQTIQSFENPPKAILLTQKRYGPFFRVDGKDFVVKGINGSLRLNRDYVMYMRTNAIREYLSNNTLLTSELKVWLKRNELEIEMDHKSELLNLITTKVPPKHNQELEKIYERTSRGRWAGLTQPNNFEEADELYHLKPHIENRTHSHLFRFYLNVSELSDCKSVAFFGEIKNGLSFQFKFNNAAMERIVKIEEIKNTGWPYKHTRENNL